MDTPVIPDIADAPSVGPASPALDTAPPARSVRRFSFDPTSSPVLAAALAWESAAPH